MFSPKCRAEQSREEQTRAEQQGALSVAVAVVVDNLCVVVMR
jgi:hypothetical protein